MTDLLVVVFRMLSGPLKGYRRKKPVGSRSQKKDVTQDEPEKEADDEGTEVGPGDVGLIRCRPVEGAPPALLYLAAELLRPSARHCLDKEAEKNDGQRIPKGLEVRMRTEGVNGSAVGATAALYPDKVFKGLEIAKHITMPPEADAPAGRAASGLLPGVFSAEVVKFLYINPAV
jgi:hypothetical protein